MADLSKLVICPGPGPHHTDDNSCVGGCGGYGYWTETANTNDLIETLKAKFDTELIESVSFAGVGGPDWTFHTDKPGRYLVVVLEEAPQACTFCDEGWTLLADEETSDRSTTPCSVCGGVGWVAT